MILNRNIFFSEIKANGLFKSLSKLQVAGMEAILDKWEQSGYTDLRWLAYMFGTVLRECGTGMYPVEEIGKGKKKRYGKKIKHSGVPYVMPDKIYYGRGYVQLTWFENYETMTRLLGVDLLNHPDQALDPKIATMILFEGMTKGASSFGDFTGKCLEIYFNDKKEDWINARRIINGLDHADEIAKNSKIFYLCLKKAA